MFLLGYNQLITLFLWKEKAKKNYCIKNRIYFKKYSFFPLLSHCWGKGRDVSWSPVSINSQYKRGNKASKHTCTHSCTHTQWHDHKFETRAGHKKFFLIKVNGYANEKSWPLRPAHRSQSWRRGKLQRAQARFLKRRHSQGTLFHLMAHLIVSVPRAL